MQKSRCRRSFVKTHATVGLLLLNAILVRGQDAPKSTSSSTSPNGSTADTRALADAIRDLQVQIQSLNSQMRAEELRAAAESRELRRQLDLTRERLAALAGGTITSDSASEGPGSSSTLTSLVSAQTTEEQTAEQRISKLEEDQALTEAKINDQNQIKVESGSKYRVRLSGVILLNLFDNQGSVDNQDFPQIASSASPFDTAKSFGGSLRQSQIGLEVFGPDIGGAHTSANVKFDFAGGFPNAPNGATMGLVRLRTGTIRLDWANTSVVAGQDSLFFAPLSPTSLASLAIPALSYAGNLWAWAPQIRIEHRIHLSEDSSLLLQGGILDSFSGDLPFSQYQRYPQWGEQSGQPAYAARVAWNYRAFGQNFTLGVGGYYGRQTWGFDRSVDSWAGTTDLTLPLGRFFELSGEFYRGRAVGGLGGGIGQTVLMSGPFIDPATKVQGLDSMGGWAQLKFKPKANFEVNGAVGQDNPFASELRRFPLSESYYGSLLSRNLSPSVNFIYRVRSDILFSMEYRRLRTFVLDSNSNTANHVNLSLGYIF